MTENKVSNRHGLVEISTEAFLLKMDKFVDSDLEIIKQPTEMKLELIRNMKSINAIFTKYGKILSEIINDYPDELVIHVYIIVNYVMSIKKILFARRILNEYHDVPLLFLLKLKNNYVNPELTNLHLIVISFHTKKNNMMAIVTNTSEFENITSLLSKSDCENLEKLKKKNKTSVCNSDRKRIKNEIFAIQEKAYKKSYHNPAVRKVLYERDIKEYKQQQKLQQEQSDKPQTDNFNYNMNEDELNIELATNNNYLKSQLIESRAKEYLSVGADDDEDVTSSASKIKRKRNKKLQLNIVDNGSMPSIDNRKLSNADEDEDEEFEKSKTEGQIKEFSNFNDIFNNKDKCWDDSSDDETFNSDNKTPI
jgi:hypothetical protein